MWDLWKQIAAEKGQTVEQAAGACGVSRWAVWRILSGRVRGGAGFWERTIRWSGGRITPNDLFAETIAEVRSAGVVAAPIPPKRTKPRYRVPVGRTAGRAAADVGIGAGACPGPRAGAGAGTGGGTAPDGAPAISSGACRP